MCLRHEDLWCPIEPDLDGDGNEMVQDKKREQIALAKICLFLKSSCYPHVKNARTTKEAWKNLQKLLKIKVSRKEEETQVERDLEIEDTDRQPNEFPDYEVHNVMSEREVPQDVSEVINGEESDVLKKLKNVGGSTQMQRYC
ncbi:hypothetical protein Trydic_g11874 [Trypoxylus dichotomus]